MSRRKKSYDSLPCQIGQLVSHLRRRYSRVFPGRGSAPRYGAYEIRHHHNRAGDATNRLYDQRQRFINGRIEAVSATGVDGAANRRSSLCSSSPRSNRQDSKERLSASMHSAAQAWYRGIFKGRRAGAGPIRPVWLGDDGAEVAREKRLILHAFPPPANVFFGVAGYRILVRADEMRESRGIFGTYLETIERPRRGGQFMTAVVAAQVRATDPEGAVRLLHMLSTERRRRPERYDLSRAFMLKTTLEEKSIQTLAM